MEIEDVISLLIIILAFAFVIFMFVFVSLKAKKNGRSALGYFVLSLFITPLLSGYWLWASIYREKNKDKILARKVQRTKIKYKKKDTYTNRKENYQVDIRENVTLYVYDRFWVVYHFIHPIKLDGSLDMRYNGSVAKYNKLDYKIAYAQLKYLYNVWLENREHIPEGITEVGKFDTVFVKDTGYYIIDNDYLNSVDMRKDSCVIHTVVDSIYCSANNSYNSEYQKFIKEYEFLLNEADNYLKYKNRS